jgi:hypothetical protein
MGVNSTHFAKILFSQTASSLNDLGVQSYLIIVVPTTSNPYNAGIWVSNVGAGKTCQPHSHTFLMLSLFKSFVVYFKSDYGSDKSK